MYSIMVSISRGRALGVLKKFAPINSFDNLLATTPEKRELKTASRAPISTLLFTHTEQCCMKAMMKATYEANYKQGVIK